MHYAKPGGEKEDEVFAPSIPLEYWVRLPYRPPMRELMIGSAGCAYDWFDRSDGARMLLSTIPHAELLSTSFDS
jgi:hypothetical protein